MRFARGRNVESSCLSHSPSSAPKPVSTPPSSGPPTRTSLHKKVPSCGPFLRLMQFLAWLSHCAILRPVPVPMRYSSTGINGARTPPMTYPQRLCAPPIIPSPPPPALTVSFCFERVGSARGLIGRSKALHKRTHTAYGACHTARQGLHRVMTHWLQIIAPRTRTVNRFNQGHSMTK